jgi:SAM-dependent methyltransferase
VAELSHPNLEVRVHDVLKDDLPEGEFDLVHTRLLLAWLRDPRVGLERLIAALKPGGLLLGEEIDFVSSVPDPRMEAASRALFERVVNAHNTVLAEQHSFDPFYGRRVAGDLEDAGLADTGSEGRASVWHGGGPGGRIWQLTIAQLRESIIDLGLMSPTEVDAALALCDDPRLTVVSPLMMASWGRRSV